MGHGEVRSFALCEGSEIGMIDDAGAVSLGRFFAPRCPHPDHGVTVTLGFEYGGSCQQQLVPGVGSNLHSLLCAFLIGRRRNKGEGTSKSS